MNLRTRIKLHPVASFIIFTMGLSFSAFLLPMLFSIPAEGAFSSVVFVAVNFPAIVALVLVTVIGGRKGLIAFLRQSLSWRIPVKWYLIALVLGALVPIGGVIAALLTGMISTISIISPTVFLIVIFLLAFLEEIGWRGFALRYLLKEQSPFIATLIVGIPWALLHFALWAVFVPDVSPIAEGSVVLISALLSTWIYVRSGRNLLVATVEHGMFNAAGMLIGVNLPAIEGIWYYLLSVCLIAAVLMVIDWRMWFTKPKQAITNQSVTSTAYEPSVVYDNTIY